MRKHSSHSQRTPIFSCILNRDHPNLTASPKKQFFLKGGGRSPPRKPNQPQNSHISRIPPEFYIQKVPGDGNCLFTSISRSYKDVTGVFLSQKSLRQKCVDHIVSQSFLNQRFADHIDFNNYVTSMYQDGTYGDELCLTSLAIALGLTIHVFTPMYGTQTFHSNNLDEQRCLRLAFNGIDHFDAVMNRCSPVPSNHSYFSFRNCCELLSQQREPTISTSDGKKNLP